MKALTILLVLAFAATAVAAPFTEAFSVKVVMQKHAGRMVKPISQPLPEYPSEMLAQGLVGGAAFRLSIGGDGSIRKLTELWKSDAVSAETIVRAVKQWRFSAAPANGPTDCELEYMIVFEIRDNDEPTRR